MKKMFRGSAATTTRTIILQVLLGTAALGYFVQTGQYSFILYSALLFYAFMQVLHNVALHKYFSHNSFKTTRFWHVILSIASPLACAGSPYAYAMSHRAHHIFSDTEKDPHGKYLSFFKIAMFDWNFKKIPIRTAESLNDKWIMIAHNYYLGIILLFYVILGFIDFRLALVYNVSVLLLWLAYISINILNHREAILNYRNFNTGDGSFNNIFVGYIVGEWHNNHHKNPQQWNQKIKWWEFDMSAQLIKLIALRKDHG